MDTGLTDRPGPEQPVPKPTLWEKIGGVLLILVGLIGLILPIMPGWVFIFAGLALLGDRRIYHWAKARYERHRGGRGGSTPAPPAGPDSEKKVDTGLPDP
jgi:hypothetical protein